jgi:hypothetical protein
MKDTAKKALEESLQEAFKEFIEKWEKHAKFADDVSTDVISQYLKDVFRGEAIGIRKVIDDLKRELLITE